MVWYIGMTNKHVNVRCGSRLHHTCLICAFHCKCLVPTSAIHIVVVSSALSRPLVAQANYWGPYYCDQWRCGHPDCCWMTSMVCVWNLTDKVDCLRVRARFAALMCAFTVVFSQTLAHFVSAKKARCFSTYHDHSYDKFPCWQWVAQGKHTQHCLSCSRAGHVKCNSR